MHRPNDIPDVVEGGPLDLPSWPSPWVANLSSLMPNTLEQKVQYYATDCAPISPEVTALNNELTAKENDLRLATALLYMTSIKGDAPRQAMVFEEIATRFKLTGGDLKRRITRFLIEGQRVANGLGVCHD